MSGAGAAAAVPLTLISYGLRSVSVDAIARVNENVPASVGVNVTSNCCGESSATSKFVREIAPTTTLSAPDAVIPVTFSVAVPSLATV